MKPRRHAFDFEIDIHGARVIVARSPLTSAALTGGEVDWQIQALKNDLDALAVDVKRAVSEKRSSPSFLSEI